MDALLENLCELKNYAILLLFFLLLGSGLCLPFSEDLILLLSGALSASCFSESPLIIYGIVYFGSLFSAWEAYWLGRHFGPRIFETAWLKLYVTESRVSKIKQFLEKWGIFAFILGRFMPGGIRNVLFITSGLGKMPFSLFVLRDSFGSFLSNSCFFLIGYKLTLHHRNIKAFLKEYDEVAFVILFLLISLLVAIYVKKRKN